MGSAFFYEMIINHNYASKLEVQYNNIKEPTYEQMWNSNFNRMRRTERTSNFEKFIEAEDAKTLFLINYAYTHKLQRIDSSWLGEINYINNGEIVNQDGRSSVYNPSMI